MVSTMFRLTFTCSFLFLFLFFFFLKADYAWVCLLVKRKKAGTVIGRTNSAHCTLDIAIYSDCSGVYNKHSACSKVAQHEVQLPLYYTHFEIAQIQVLVSSNILLMQSWASLRLNSYIFWGCLTPVYRYRYRFIGVRMLVHRRVTPSWYHLYTWVKRSTVREHNTVTPARARTRTTRSGVERTNHEATAPPLTNARTLALKLLSADKVNS